MEDAAELEKLSKEKHLDKIYRDRITRIVGDVSSSSNQLHANNTSHSQISTKKQVCCSVRDDRFDYKSSSCLLLRVCRRIQAPRRL